MRSKIFFSIKRAAAALLLLAALQGCTTFSPSKIPSMVDDQLQIGTIAGGVCETGEGGNFLYGKYPLNCTYYAPSYAPSGHDEYYRGHLWRAGLDIGDYGHCAIYFAVAPTIDMEKGSLLGTYVGVSFGIGLDLRPQFEDIEGGYDGQLFVGAGEHTITVGPLSWGKCHGTFFHIGLMKIALEELVEEPYPQPSSSNDKPLHDFRHEEEKPKEQPPPAFPTM